MKQKLCIRRAAWSEFSLALTHGFRLMSLEVHIGTPIDRCREINTRALGSDNKKAGYPIDIFDNLVYRYEEPNGMTRWDSPLFTIPYDDEAPPCQDIWDAMIGSEGQVKTARPNQATVMVESLYFQLVDLNEAHCSHRNLPPSPITFTSLIKPHRR